jgi:hypothetical protein
MSDVFDSSIIVAANPGTGRAAPAQNLAVFDDDMVNATAGGDYSSVISGIIEDWVSGIK